MKVFKTIIVSLLALLLTALPASACTTHGGGYGYCQYCGYGGYGYGYGYQECGYSYEGCGYESYGSCGYQDYSSYEGCGYYDSYGHYCEYSGYYDGCGNYIQTVGYYEGGVWYPAQYDAALDVGYYDEYGNYYYYGNSTSWGYGGSSYSGGYGGCSGGGYVSCGASYCCSCGGYGCATCGWTGYAQYIWDDCSYGGYYDYYDENATWACDNLQWLEQQDDDWYCDDWLIDVDVNADTINIINNGVIIYSGTCTCTSMYSGQEFCFGDQRCAGIWNTCSSGFYEQACNCVGDGCRVCCH